MKLFFMTNFQKLGLAEFYGGILNDYLFFYLNKCIVKIFFIYLKQYVSLLGMPMFGLPPILKFGNK